MDMSKKRKMIGLAMEDKRHMLIIFKDNSNWSQHAIVDELTRNFAKR